MAQRVLVKLGGGLITAKEKLCVARMEVIDACTNAFARLQEEGWNPIIVHGAGGFGHQRAKEFNLAQGMDSSIEGQEEAIRLVREDMLSLNSLVCESMMNAGLKVASFPPHTWAKGTGPNFFGDIEIFRNGNGIVPVTFGDVTDCDDDSRFGILSGDHLMQRISSIDDVSKAIFLLDGIDGLMDSPEKGELIEHLTAESRFTTRHDDEIDVTGGMALKVECAQSMAQDGLEVWLIDGTKPERMLEAVLHGKTIGTLVS